MVVLNSSLYEVGEGVVILHQWSDQLQSNYHPNTAGSCSYTQLYCHWVPIVLIHCHGLGPVSLTEHGVERTSLVNVTKIMTDNLIPLMYTFLSVVNCGSLNIPTNGGITTTEGTTYQSTAIPTAVTLATH